MLFEQTQSIVSRIQQILREYPYGDAVLLELLQNADDAGATSCHINVVAPAGSWDAKWSPLAGVSQTNLVRDLQARVASLTSISSGSSSSSSAAAACLPSSVPLPSEDLVRAVMCQQACAATRRSVLEFYNNSVFTERDLNNIQNIGGSTTDSKKHDGTKVGRFGLGFNSAYHISDVIAFVSLRALVVFDPSRTFLPPDAPGQPRGGGYRWDYISESARLEGLLRDGKHAQLKDKDWFFLLLLDMFQSSASNAATPLPAGQTNALPSSSLFSKQAPFQGTLFRLPLRCEASALWREVHTVHDISDLVVRFPSTAATLGLVLTKNVARITASVTTITNKPSTATASTMDPSSNQLTVKPLYELLSSGGADEAVKRTKANYIAWLHAFTQVMQNVAKVADAGGLTEGKSIELRKTLPKPEKYQVSVSVRFARTSLCCSAQQHGSSPAATFSDRFCGGQPIIAGTTTTTSFVAAHQFGPGGPRGWEGSQVWAIAEECARYQHPISVPWSATIVADHKSLLPPASEPATNNDSNEKRSGGGGTLMCFFPIRTSTGLPVHIHGYFQLSSDRQSVSSVDKSRWNSALCSEVVPHSYASAVVHYSVPMSISGESTLRLWPLGVYSDDVTVEMIAASTLSVLRTLAVFPCRGNAPGLAAGTGPTDFLSTVSQSRQLPWPIKYETMGNVRGFAAQPTPSSPQDPNDRRVPILDITTQAYAFLLATLPLGGQLLYFSGVGEFSTLAPEVASAFQRRQLQTSFVDPAYLRSALSAAYCEATKAITTPPAKQQQPLALPLLLKAFQTIPTHIALVLMCACLRDGNLQAFVQLSDRSELPPMIPLATGFGGQLRTTGTAAASSSKATTTTTNVALLCGDYSWYELADGVPPLRSRLIVYLEEESGAAAAGQQEQQQQVKQHNTGDKQPPGAKNTNELVILRAATPNFFAQAGKSSGRDDDDDDEFDDDDDDDDDDESRQIDARRAVGVPRHLVDAARRYLLHLRYSDVIEMFDATTFPTLLHALLRSSPITTFLNKNHITGPSGSTSWELELGAHRMSNATVRRLLQCLSSSFQPSSHYFCLAILPAFMPAMASLSGNSSEVRRPCVSALDGVCIAVLSGPTLSSSMASLRDVLVFLGATHIDHDIFPEALLRKWSDGSSSLIDNVTTAGSKSQRLTQIAVLEDTTHGARAAVAALRVLLQGRPIATLLTSSPEQGRLSPLHEVALPQEKTSVTRADAIRGFFSRYREELTLSDVEFLSSLPMFRTIWGTFVALKDSSNGQGGGQQVASAFLLPPELSHIADLALRRGTFAVSSTAAAISQDAKQCLGGIALIERRRDDHSDSDRKNTPQQRTYDEGDALATTFALDVLPQDVALALAATRVVPLGIHIEKQVDQQAIGAFWSALFEAFVHYATASSKGAQKSSSNSTATIMTSSKDIRGAALQLLSTCPIFSKVSTAPIVWPASSHIVLENGVATSSHPVLASTHLQPCSVVDDQEMPFALIELLKSIQQQQQQQQQRQLGSTSAAQKHLLSAIPSITSVGMIDPFLAESAEHRQAVFRLLGVKRGIDGAALVALVNAASELFETRRREHSSGDDEELMHYASAALQQLDASTDITEDQWKQIGMIGLVPTSSLERGGGASTAPVGTFLPMGRVCWQHVHRLCPSGRRQCIHPGLLTVTMSSTTAAAKPSKTTSAAPSTSNTGSTGSSFARLSKRFLWNEPPPLKDILSFIEHMGAVGATPLPTEITSVGIDVREWSLVLDHVEQQLRVFLSTNRREGGEEFPVLPSTATTGLPDFVDALLANPDEFMDLLKGSFRRVYFPSGVQRGGSGGGVGAASFLVSQLAFDPLADLCAPFLATVDKATAARYPALWSTLGVQSKHTFASLLQVLDDILLQASVEDVHTPDDTVAAAGVGGSVTTHVDPTSMAHSSRNNRKKISGTFVGTPLSHSLRKAYAHVLSYLTQSYPTESRERCKVDKTLLVPTADGAVNWGHVVNYNVAAVAATSDGSCLDPHSLLHPDVRTDVAKALGMAHTGIQLVAQMHAKHSRPGATFRAKGQRQSVVNAIKRILGDYSDQQSVIMEMLQNADDAGATTVTFTLDHRRFAGQVVEELLGKEMVRCQGPSLIVTNDKLFMPTDFDALFEIGCGHKTRDPTSIGRFGVGFNSVYHVTDCPSIVSGDNTLFLDPSTAHLDSATPEAPGVMINHSKEPTLSAMFPAQLAPYQRYGIDFKKHYNGTLFRLPLRLEPWEHSISPNAWTVVDMRRVFTNFLTFMPHVLLFMRNVEEIRFTEVSAAEGNINGRESVLASVRLRDPQPAGAHPSDPLEATDALREYRAQLAVFAATLHPEKPIRTPLHAFCVTDAVVEVAASGRVSVHSWLLSTNIRSIASGPELTSCSSELKRKLVPWGSVAIPLRDTGKVGVQHTTAAFDHVGVEDGGDADTAELNESVRSVQRRIYQLGKAMTRAAQSMVHCYLPLPSVKGELPFHVHGCFALTSDRRGMWTQSLTEDASWEVTWNRYILTDVIADAALHAVCCHPPLFPAENTRSSSSSMRAPSSNNLSKDEHQQVLAEYYNVFPAAASFNGALPTDAGDGGGQQQLQMSAASTSTTEVFRSLRSGFFDIMYRTAASVLWCTQGHYIAVQRACCAPFRASNNISGHGAATLALTGIASSGGAGGAGGTSIPSSLLPFQLSEGLAELVLVDEQLCYIPQEVFQCLLTAADDLHAEPPSELNPRKIAKELYQRAGSSQGISVAFASLLSLPHTAPAAAATPASAAPSTPPQVPQKAPLARQASNSIFGRIASAVVGTSVASAASSGHTASPGIASSSSASSAASSATSPPFALMAELTLYLTQLNDPALLHDVPLVLLRDGTVGVVGKLCTTSSTTTAATTTTAVANDGASTGNHNAQSAVFIAPDFARDVEQLFSSVPVVDERYFNTVVTMASKKSQQQQQQLSSLSSRQNPQQQRSAGGSAMSLLVEPFTQERWSLLLGVEALQVKTIYRLLHLHAAAHTGVEFTLGRAYPLDSSFNGANSVLRRWVIAFWRFVRKSDATVMFDKTYLQQRCGDLGEWPLVPARKAGEHVLVPLKECDLLVCGSSGAFVNEALEHLGVSVLDTDFDEWQPIRTKCNVVDIEGQKIGDLLENAVAQGRFEAMPDGHRQRMLDWLLQCNRNQRGFFRSMVGGSGPLVDSIKHLPLFPRYNAGKRDWEFAPLTDPNARGGSATNAATAMPRDAPLSPLCHGMFKNVIAELDLNEMPIKQFIMSRVRPALMRLEEPVIPLSSAQATWTLPLTTSEELEHWALVGRHLDDQIVSQLSSTVFVPRQNSRAEVRDIRIERRVQAALNTTGTQPIITPTPLLKTLAAEWIADSYYAGATSSSTSSSTVAKKTTADIVAAAKLDTKHPALFSLIRTARMDYLDRRRRFAPASIMRPVSCPGAPYPNILSHLMEFVQDLCFSKIVCPSFLWEDAATQALLVRVGVSTQFLDKDVLCEAAQAFGQLIPQTSADAADRLRMFLSTTTSSRVPVPPTLASKHHHQGAVARVAKTPSQLMQLQLRELSWSIAMCVLNIASDVPAAIKAVDCVDFIVPHPMSYLPASPYTRKCSATAATGSTRTSCVDLVAPSDCAAYGYRYAVWLEKPIMPAALSALVQAKPTALDVLAHLAALLGEHPPVTMTPRTANKVLSSTYTLLSSEYRDALAPNNLMVALSGMKSPDVRRGIVNDSQTAIFQQLSDIPGTAPYRHREQQHDSVDFQVEVPFNILHHCPVFVVPATGGYDNHHDDHNHLLAEIDNNLVESADEEDDADGNAGSFLLSTGPNSGGAKSSATSHPFITCSFVSVKKHGTSSGATGGNPAVVLPRSDATRLVPSTSAHIGEYFIKRAKLNQIISVGYSARIGNLHPHFYQIHEFESCPPLASLIHLASSSYSTAIAALSRQKKSSGDAAAAAGQSGAQGVGVPPIADVLNALNTYSQEIAPLATEQLHTYVELLKLLVLCAEHYCLQLSPEAAPPSSSVPPSSSPAAQSSKTPGAAPVVPTQRASTTATQGGQHSIVVSTAAIRLPDQDGQLTFLAQGISIADQPSLIRRILPGSVPLVHGLVPQHVARAMGCPSVGRVLQEEPRGDNLTPAALARRRREQQHRARSSGGGSALAPYEKYFQDISAKYHLFFDSPLCARVLQRLLLTASIQTQQGGGGGHPHQRGGGRNGGDASSSLFSLTQCSLTLQEISTLSALRVEFVHAISLHISHEKRPDVNLANGHQSPPFALSAAASTVFVVDPRVHKTLTSTSTRTTTAVATTPHNYLVAMAINRLLRNRLISVIAPLACVLEHATKTTTPTSAPPARSLLLGGSQATAADTTPPMVWDAIASDVDDNDRNDKAKQRQTEVVPPHLMSTTSPSGHVVGTIHAILDTFDCADIVATSTAPSSASAAAHPRDETAPIGALAAFEAQHGRLLNIPSLHSTINGGSDSVAKGRVVDDYWMMKYGVSDVIMEGEDDGSGLGSPPRGVVVQQQRNATVLPLFSPLPAHVATFLASNQQRQLNFPLVMVGESSAAEGNKSGLFVWQEHMTMLSNSSNGTPQGTRGLQTTVARLQFR